MPAYLETTDKAMRSVLINSLKNKGSKKIFSEYTLPNVGVRADIVLLDNIMHGYELKSDVDSLKRLQSQIQGYNTFFDKITLVVGKKHLHEIMYSVPDWWGIMLARNSSNVDKIVFVNIREAENNPMQKVESFTNLLWKMELKELAKKYGVGLNLAPKSKSELVRLLVSNVSNRVLRNDVRQIIGNRVPTYAAV